MSESSRDAVCWGRTLIRFDYRFARRRTLAISVHPDMRVEVVAPVGTGVEVIREKVRKRAPWITRCRRDFELLLPPPTPRTYTSGETHYYLGRRYRLRIEAGPEDSVTLERGRLRATVRDESDSRRARKLVLDWYRKRAGVVFSECLESQLAAAHREGFPTPRVQIRGMVTRWGSCSRRGLITLNPLLVRAPKECIAYVIAHELCHLKEPHHGPRFWRLLERLLPDYEERRAKLRSFSQLISL